MELFFLAVLFCLMIVALGSGFPVAFALPGSALLAIGLAASSGWLFTGSVDAYFAQGGPFQWLSAGVTNLRGVYWEAERDTLIAIPLFIFMGIMLQRSKIAEDLLVTMAQLFGPVPGGLGISVVFVGALLAATTGIVGATVVAMGLISLPAMLRSNYSIPLATGTIAASGTLGQIIPPSIVLIILADQLSSATDQASTARTELYKASTGELSMPSQFSVESTSAGDMFLGAFVPGLVLVGLYMAFIMIAALIRPSLAPAVPYEGSRNWRFAAKVLMTLVPPLALIIIVLGSIIAGIATVNQAGAIGAAGAMVMAGYRLYEGRRDAYWPAIIAVISLVVIGIVTSNFDLNIRTIDTTNDVIGVTVAIIAVLGLILGLGWSGWRAIKTDNTLHGVMVETAKTTSLVFIILMGAAMLTASFRGFGGEDLVREFLTGLPGGFWTQFVIVMAVIFVLGFFLDFIEISVVVVPIVAPILLVDPAANVTAVWLGVMIGLNIQTSFLTPPFGFALFYLRGVAPAAVRTVQIYKGVVAFIGLQLIALLIVGGYPPLVNYLPSRIKLTSSTAPPPQNPRLQICIEDYIAEEFAENGAEIRTAIEKVKSLDLSVAPEKLRKDLAESFDKAAQAFDDQKKIVEAQAAVEAAAGAYRPIHDEVRRLESDIRKIDTEVADLEQRIRFRQDDAELSATLQERIDALEDEKAAQEAEIPGSWDATHETFAKLTKEETNARRKYRRTVDDAAEPPDEAIKIIEDRAKLEAQRDALLALREPVRTTEMKDAGEAVKAVYDALSHIEGAREIRSALSDARKSLTKRRNPSREDAIEELDQAITLFEAEIAWRTEAEKSLLPGLREYQTAIEGTIGLRQQDVLPRKQALYVAGCQSYHTDISLSF